MQELLARCRSGETDAIEAFVTQVYPWALRYANSILRDHHLAEDATQEALITAISRLDSLRDDAAVFAWLRQIIRTKVNRIQRKRKDLVLGELKLQASTEHAPQAETEVTHLRNMVRNSLQQLPDRGREAVELFYFNERSIAEVSRSMGIPAGTVKRRLFDARKRLFGIFSSYGLKPEKTRNGDGNASHQPVGESEIM